jgi:diguanylate cyclase (GGDEF)-like protein
MWRILHEIGAWLVYDREMAQPRSLRPSLPDTAPVADRGAFVRAVGVALVGILAVGGILAADLRIRPDPALSTAYLVPVAAVGWAGGRRAGIFVAVAATAAATVADGLGQFDLVPVALSLLVNVAMAWMFGNFRTKIAHERRLARTDPVTGGNNRRGFDERIRREVRRHARGRRPLTLICLDLDDFKRINDTRGHAAGDAVLSAVATTLESCVRETDFVARHGGDEFVVLLPETGADGAGALLGRLQGALAGAMAEHGWAVTFSIGAVTFQTPPRSERVLLRICDDRMYQAKRAGKNRVHHEVLDGARSAG